MNDNSTKYVPESLVEEYTPTVFNASVPEDAPPYHGEAAVDIVAVHGLAAQYPRTWSVKRGDGTRYYWLSQKLPQDLPDARVLGFKYDSEWYENPAHSSLREYGAQLLRCLVRDRCHPGKPTMCPTKRTRPIIFIGHSFGGLVIKQALVLAGQTLPSNALREDYENHRDILSAVAGIIFLGTPHRGSGFSIWADIKAGLGMLRGKSVNRELLAIMKVDSAMTTYLGDEFNSLYMDSRLSGLKVVCYWEDKELALPPHIVVDQESARLDYAACRAMNASHMEMNKFHDGSQRDENYDHLLVDIRMLYESSPQIIPKRFNSWEYGSAAPSFDREQLLLWLSPSREPQKTRFLDNLATQKSAPYTCQWINALEPYIQLTATSSRSNMLWIHGKAGSGKSVLAAYLVDQFSSKGAAGAYTSAETDAIVCDNIHGQRECLYKRHTSTVLFFFCGVDRANETPEKLIDTLLHQLLLSHPKNEMLFSMASGLRRVQRDGADAGSLAKLLLDISSKVGPVYVIIDGLEENDQLARCVTVLSRVCTSETLKIIFLSQATNEVSKALSKSYGPQDPIVITEHTRSDIDHFTVEKSAKMVERKHELKEKESLIATYLQGGAEGMFQWVNSVLDYLEEEVDDSKDVERRLRDLPSDLILTYEKIFERLARTGNDHRDGLIRVALQFLAANGTIVSPLDVKTAISIYEKKDGAIIDLLDFTETPEAMAMASTEMRNLLGSLVDFPSDGTIRLSHPSLRSALIRPLPTGSQDKPSARYKFTIEEAHMRILQLSMQLCARSTFVHANAFKDTRPPLVEYAWSYWAYHFYQSKSAFEPKSTQLNLDFDTMIKGVSGAALAYIDALVMSLCQPLRAVPGRFSDREYTLSLKRAQESLIQPTKDLVQMRERLPLSYHLCDARGTVQFSSERKPDALVPYMHHWRRSTAMETLESLKKKFVGCETEVQQLKIDELHDQLAWLQQPAGLIKLVLDIARNLRLVTLRLAVDPIYTSLILTAEGKSFSPLHPLLYLSQMFEQAGTYPYWNLSPPSSDLLDNFMCAQDDPEYIPAKFVLHCFEWREQKSQIDQGSQAGRYVRFPQVMVIGPRPSGHHLNRVSTDNINQVRRLHAIPSERYFFAQQMYAFMKADDNTIRHFITNPLSYLHIKTSLMIEESELGGEILPLTDSHQAMGMIIPEWVKESPLQEYVRAVPQLLKVYFVRYVVWLLEAFGKLSRQALAVHFARLEIAVAELNAALAFFSRLGPSNNLMPRLQGWYILPGLVLFWIRCRYIPLFGAYYMPHSWSEFIYAYKHPAAYLDLQNVSGFWIWFKTFLRVMLYNMIGSSAIGIGANPAVHGTSVGHVVNSYGVFHFFCAIERSLFAMGTVAATVVACSLLMMNDSKTLSEVWDFSIFWWFAAFFALFSSAANAKALHSGAGLGRLMVLCLFQILLLFLLIRYCLTIIMVCKFFLLPLTATAMFCWNNLLHSYVKYSKLCGVALMLYMVLRAFKVSHKFIWDPYDIEGSLSQLIAVSRLARSSLEPEETMRIGCFPLGEDMALQNGRSFNSVPRSALQSDLQANIEKELGNAAVRATGAALQWTDDYMSGVSRFKQD